MSELTTNFDQDVHSLLLAQGERLQLGGQREVSATILPDDNDVLLVLFDRGDDRIGLADRRALDALIQLDDDVETDAIWEAVRNNEHALLGPHLAERAHVSMLALEIMAEVTSRFDVPKDVAAWRDTGAGAFKAARESLQLHGDRGTAYAAARDLVREHQRTARHIRRSVGKLERTKNKPKQRRRPKRH